MKLWNWNTAKVETTLTGHDAGGGNFPFAGYVTGVAFSAHSKALASASHDKTIRLWDLPTTRGKSLQPLSGHTAAVTSVTFSPDVTKVASGSLDRSVRLWDLVSGETVEVLAGHAGEVTSVEFSPDGEWLVSSSFDKTLRLWKLKADK